jgi:SAM-dependent methyltransferase
MREPDRVLELTVSQNGVGDRTLVRFVESGGHLQILAPRNPLPKWALALSASRIAVWRIGGREFTGLAVPVLEPDVAEVLNRFQAEFGPDRVRQWFGSSVQGFELHAGPAEGATYRTVVESYFDEIAASYDHNVASNPLDMELRTKSLEALSGCFRLGDRVLELGCGTGLETLKLAVRGIGVLAIDISGEMIRLLKEKAGVAGLGGVVEARQLAASDIARLLDEFGPGSFDGAFSTFGALNCEENIDPIPGTLAALLRPNSTALFGIWNRCCVAEIALSIAARNPRRALGRQRTPVPVGLSRYGIPVYAYSLASFVRPFLPYFKVERVVGLPVFVPPYDFARITSNRHGLLQILQHMDSTFASRFPFNRLGDHFLVAMKRRQSI